MAPKVGFIGLGNIGQPMAESIAKKGFDLTVFDLRKEPLEALKKLGAKTAASCKEVGKLCDIIIIQVVDTKQVEDVIFGAEGLMAAAKPGTLIVIGSTVTPGFCKKAHELCAAKGVDTIDAPVSGGARGAAAGTLSIMVDGDPKLLEKCRPVLQAMAKEIFHFGEIGQAQVVKAAKNLVSNSEYLAICEAVALITRAGVDMEQFFSLVRGTTGNCWALGGKNWDLWWTRKFSEPKTIYLTEKDTKQAVDAGKEYGIRLEHAEGIAKMDIFKLLSSVPREAVLKHMEGVKDDPPAGSLG